MKLPPVTRFAVLSLLCVVALAVVMGFALSALLSRAVSEWEWENTAALARREVELAGVEAFFTAPLGSEERARWGGEISRRLMGLPEVVRVKIWNREGTVIWSDEPELIGRRFPGNRELDVSLAGKVAVEIKELTKPEHEYEQERFGTLAEVYVPILSKQSGQVLGVVEVYKRPVRLFATFRWGLIIIWSISLAGGLALYLVLLPLVRQFYGREVQEETLRAHAGQLEQEVAERTRELKAYQARLEALLEVSRQLSRAQPLEPLLGAIAEACGNLLNSDSVGIRLVEGDGLVLTGTWGDAKEAMPTPRLRIGQSLSGVVAATGEPLLVGDLGNDPRLIPEHREAARRLGHRSFLGVPVKVGERVVGVLSIRTRRDSGFSAEDLALATAFASHAAIALENAHMERRVAERS